MEQFPEYPPFEGSHASIIPHLSVSNGSAQDAALVEAKLKKGIAACGGVRAHYEEISLFENIAGNLNKTNGFKLGG